MKIVLNRQLLGLEDIAFGFGTVDQTRGDQVVTITLVNAANLPFNETQTLNEVLTTNYPMIEAVGNDLININLVAADLANIDITATNIANVITVGSNMTDLLSIVSQIIPNLAEILLADFNAATAIIQANNSKLSAWESEAFKLTADSYATEPEDVFVKVYTSNGDGTFTVTNTAEYSSFHWQQKAYALVSGGLIDDANITTTTTYSSQKIEQVVVGLIDDATTHTDKTYSSIKIQELHDAQAQAIANLAGASATFYNNTTQSVPETPTAFVDLTWTNGQASTNTNILDLGVNSFILKQNGSYNFFNTLTFNRIGSSAIMDVTFELYDSVSNTVIATFVQHIDIAANSSESVPMNALVLISGLTTGQSKTIKVRMQATSAAGTLELSSFNSILALASINNTATIDSIDTALGAIYGGLA